MDIQDNGKTVTADGAVFAKLSPNDRRKLLAPVKADLRVKLKENLKEGGITGEEYVNEMDAFDQAVFGDTKFFSYLQSIEGRSEIISLACRKANPDEAKAAAVIDNLVMALDEDFGFAAMLAGVKLAAPAVADDTNTTDAPADQPAPEPEPRPSGAGS